MNKKRSAIAFVIILFVLITALIVYIFSELYSENEIPGNNPPENKDALKFKTDYESLNGEKNGDNVIRTISIPEDNPFIYKTEDELVEMIENKETFIVYFGFTKCPWCRSMLPTLIESAKNNKIDKIYYVDVLNIRDTYELNAQNKAVKSKDGTEGYYKLLELLEPVLSNYSPLTYKKGKKTIEVKVNEKRIYAPNIVVVKNGNPISLETGISSLQKDAYQELTDEIKCEMKKTIDCLLEEYIKDDNTCSVGEPIC